MGSRLPAGGAQGTSQLLRAAGLRRSLPGPDAGQGRGWRRRFCDLAGGLRGLDSASRSSCGPGTSRRKPTGTRQDSGTPESAKSRVAPGPHFLHPDSQAPPSLLRCVRPAGRGPIQPCCPHPPPLPRICPGSRRQRSRPNRPFLESIVAPVPGGSPPPPPQLGSFSCKAEGSRWSVGRSVGPTRRQLDPAAGPSPTQSLSHPSGGQEEVAPSIWGARTLGPRCRGKKAPLHSRTSEAGELKVRTGRSL